jgi:hypothetical protein
VTEPGTSTAKTRVRWGWIVSCIALGLVAMWTGYLLVPPPDHAAYVGSVLANVGTTLLLVGFVVLLERRIVDTTARIVQRAVAADRKASDARIERMVRDFEDRLTAEWAQTDATNVDAMKRRTGQLTDEMVDRVVDEANAASATETRNQAH